MSENETTPENQEGAAAPSDNAQQAQAGFALDRVYLKDLSFESPNAPEVFAKEWNPEFKMDLNTKHKPVEEGVYEVSVCVTLTATVEGMTAYIAEVEQGGVFQVVGVQGLQLAQVLSSACPTVLFPYLREAMDNVIVKGSFAPSYLAPVNFDAIFANAVRKKQAELEKAQAEAAAQAEDSTTH
ncbi:MAG: protein-export chaperone SecB [Oleiphilus sp.]|nr:MAG: protein-export chaperone SecB [Oleiphilus sp.]